MPKPLGTYALINSTTLGSNSSTIEFTSVPGTYTDLILVINGALNTGANPYGLRYNSDSGTNYSWTSLRGDGSSATSARDSGSNRILCGWISTSRVCEIIHIQDYANTTTNKTNIARNNSTAASTYVSANVGLWRNTTAITTVTLVTDSNSFASGTVVKLYGVTAGNQ